MPSRMNRREFIAGLGSGKHRNNAKEGIICEANIHNDACNAADSIRLSEHIEGTDGFTIFGHACAMGLEGIVAKRRDRPYRSGRCPDWVKVKNPQHPAIARAELIILSKRRQARRPA